MDIEGIDVAVMYGTRGRRVLSHDNLPPDYAAALARTYNWTHDYCAHDPMRLKFAGQVAMHDIPSAVAERGAALPNRARSRSSAPRTRSTASTCTTRPASHCGPRWRLGAPVGFNPPASTSLMDDPGRRYVGSANFRPIAHAIRKPVELMGAITSMTTGGVLERHPGLRCAFLEGTPAGSTGGLAGSTASGKSSALAASAS